MVEPQVIPPPCIIASTLGQVCARRAGFGIHPPSPLPRTGFRIVRLQVARDIEIVAAHADDDVVADDERREVGVVELLEIADLGAPLFTIRAAVERARLQSGVST